MLDINALTGSEDGEKTRVVSLCSGYTWDILDLDAGEGGGLSRCRADGEAVGGDFGERLVTIQKLSYMNRCENGVLNIQCGDRSTT
jgi:hypothetical protein